MSWLEAIRVRLRLLFARGDAEMRMEEEIRFHLEMEEERLIREEGLDPAEARRRARVAFGGLEKTREELREGRGLAWLSGLRLDLKLGARMLAKNPVLTTASVLALAIAIALAASWFEFMTDLVRPRIPLPEADRVVVLRTVDLSVADRDASGESRVLHDFEAWREELRSVTQLAAVAQGEYPLTTEDGRFATLKGARATPSMFDVARVRPVMGRVLREEDARPGADPVVVLGYDAWHRLFDGAPSAVGRTIHVGADHATVVGVMPESFGFPVHHQVWTPLRERAVDYARREGPAILVVGRLARGATLEGARAELSTIGQRTAAEFPETHEHLRPEVYRMGQGGGWEDRVAMALNVPFLLFLLVVSANVATLLLARAASRESEIALRSALGASRRRIILQLVAEALVLTSLAAALGLAAAHWGLGWGMDLFFEVQQTRLPSWFDFGLSGMTILYGAALAVIGALVIGGIPGLRATRTRLWQRLPQPGAGADGMRFGAIATGVIVAQVALCVAFIPVAILNAQQNLTSDREASVFPAEAYLSGRLTGQTSSASAVSASAGNGERQGARTGELFEEVRRRLAAEPGVLAVTRTSRMPGFNHPVESVQIEDDSARIVVSRQVAVDPNFFDVAGARVVTGRGFREDDVTASDPVAVITGVWAEAVFGDRNPIGQRIRYPRRGSGQHGRDGGREANRWYEIVGVVEGIERVVGPGTQVSIFHPLRADQHSAVQLFIRTEGQPAALAPQVLSLVTAVDPGLGITGLQPLDEVWRPVQRADAFFVGALAVVAAIILLFAAIGIYALVSFTVTRRTREIGIRAALGAEPRRIIMTIFSRVMGQIGLGVLLGATLVSLTLARDPTGLRLVGLVAAGMVMVGLLGCALPARRALRIQPTEALRAE